MKPGHSVPRWAAPAAALLAVVVLAAGTEAQQPERKGLVGDLLADITEVEGKMVGLARAIPEDRFGWRPMEGVRSVGEVVMHVAADNWLMPSGVGTPPPEQTGIIASDYGTVQAYERKVPARDAAIAAMQESFTHVKKALSGTAEARLGESIQFFGQSMTVQSLWILTTTHLHEHLGQLIAYARSNGVTPPWSR